MNEMYGGTGYCPGFSFPLRRKSSVPSAIPQSWRNFSPCGPPIGSDERWHTTDGETFSWDGICRLCYFCSA